MALIDGARCFGNLAMKVAREIGIQKAREHGIGFIAVRDTHWIGALGMHLLAIAQEGFIAQAWAQTDACKDCAPFGGLDPRFSTNPIALAIPANPNPVLADFSTATMSMGAMFDLQREGRKTATPRFIDCDGRATNDPMVLKNGGSLMFVGGEIEGYKGYALSLFNEALTVLAGGSANNPGRTMHQSFSLLVLDPDAFCGAEYYRNEMERFITHVKNSRPRPGQEVRLPGERGFAALADCRENGIPLDEHKLSLLSKIAEENEIEPIA